MEGEERMSKYDLSYKLKYILNELGMNKTEFLNACKMFNPCISKPTILNVINGKNKTFPTVETLNVIIKVCKTYGNEKIRYISYDFLLNDNIKEIEAQNSLIYQSIGLSDEVITKLEQFNNPLYFDYGNIINYYLTYMPSKYWKTLNMLKLSNDIYKTLNKEIKKHDIENIKKILKLFNNDILLEYIERNFKNIYDLYIKIKHNENDIIINKLEKLRNLLKILIEYLEYKINEMNKDFLNNM